MEGVTVSNLDRGEPEATTSATSMPNGAGAVARARRTELAAFLRSRRERLTPDDVGLAPGLRRRTPGLRREEVAQLAGVGVTWYTWLEQGRRINASIQVLDAVARTLRLDPAEWEHFYRLADVPVVDEPDAEGILEPEIQTILDNLNPLAAAVYNGRYDVLRWNDTYAAVFPGVVAAQPPERNALWQLFTMPSCCSQFVNRDTELPRMVATMRAAFVRHLGEPTSEAFVHRLSAASPEFAQMWAAHDVAQPGSVRVKIYQHALVGRVRMVATSLALLGTPETRLIVYTPMDDESRARLDILRANPTAQHLCAAHASA
jgi:transcriptional regulator with XRE-family HTH domain